MSAFTDLAEQADEELAGLRDQIDRVSAERDALRDQFNELQAMHSKVCQRFAHDWEVMQRDGVHFVEERIDAQPLPSDALTDKERASYEHAKELAWNLIEERERLTQRVYELTCENNELRETIRVGGNLPWRKRRAWLRMSKEVAR